MRKFRLPVAGWFVLLVMILAGPLLLAPSAMAQRRQYIRYAKVAGRSYVYLRDVATYYGLQLTSDQTGCSLTSKFSRVRITYDKRQAQVNGIKLNFLFAPFPQGKEPLLSEMDFLQVIEPVLRAKSLVPHRIATIMLDPGHGGADHGAIGTMYREKVITLSIAQQLRDALQRRGYRVVMTRNGDATLSLAQRTAACKKQCPDLFVSIHCNAAATRTARGVETFVMTPTGAPSTSDKKPSAKVEPGNRSDRQSMRLGYSIQQQVISRAGAEDRGVRHARFYVLRNVACPAALVETGFLSNYADQVRLGRADYQGKVAEAIADGIARYHRDLRGR